MPLFSTSSIKDFPIGNVLLRDHHPVILTRNRASTAKSRERSTKFNSQRPSASDFPAFQISRLFAVQIFTESTRHAPFHHPLHRGLSVREHPVYCKSMKQNKLLERITCDPDIFGGKPIIRGHRLAVEHVLDMLAAGDDAGTILTGYPWMEPADIQACLVYASLLARNERIELFPAALAS
jgi:uncharacterized protein (DUF433 family)